ncbi:hypothetical protein QTH97_32190 [Variovorax sp. J22R24]|uniref:hypothetical protein n=1 Tax=Variovorax gracilis TaxID=3053502 RepID=UPI0025761935|nr:hypothetical protein [Variovorax sp. J22R24]MDM0109619.1 hypothetical protein [Variovorax sp. J22R24]
MARRSVQVAGQTVWIADDDPAAPELGWWAVLRTRVVDEVTEAPPHVVPRLRSDTPRCTPRISDDGVCGLIARPRDASTALVTPGALRATVEVDGYLPQVLDAAIDVARRQLPAGAAAGATVLTITPPEPAGRPQFQPGRGVMLERPLPTDPEQFTLHVTPLAPPALNQVPIADAVAPLRTVNAHVAGVPIVLPDQPLHRAEPARIRGRALRQTGPGSAPVPAPGAHVGIRGVWWTTREVVDNSVPPHPARIVGFEAPLAFAHAFGTPLERAALTPDGINRACRARAFAGATTLAVHPWAGLNPIGGDVLQIEADNSNERELVITERFDSTIDPVTPARLWLRAPLAFPHEPQAPIVHAVLGVVALGAIEREAVAGDRVLFASTLAAVTTHDLLRIGGAAADAELRFVTCVPTHNGLAFAHETMLAADGSFALPPIARIAQAQFFIEHAGHPAQQPIDFVPEPGNARTLQVLFTP